MGDVVVKMILRDKGRSSRLLKGELLPGGLEAEEKERGGTRWGRESSADR